MLEEKLKECQSKNEMLITEKLNSDARAEASEDRVEETLELYKEASAQLDDTLKRSAELEDRVNALVMGNAKREGVFPIAPTSQNCSKCTCRPRGQKVKRGTCPFSARQRR